ncbi:ESX-1 secretion-associated EspI domain protein [Mycobacterium kansasii 732]|nr:ESX-1 secretion-associated EspI domain protein [Mycobacterium kansasii 732]
MPIGGPPPAPPEPPPAPPEPPVPPSVRPHAFAEPPAPPEPAETAPPGKPVSAAEPPAGKQPSAEPPPAPPSPKPPVAPMPMGAPPTAAPPRPEAPRTPGPPPPATTWRSPSPPAAPQPSRSATEPFAVTPKPPQPPTAPTRPVATETSPHSVGAGEHQQPQHPAPPSAQPPYDAPRHSRRARRGHRYRPEPDDDEAPSATGAALPQRPSTDETQPTSRVGPASAFTWLPQSHSAVDRPSAAAPPTETHPEPTGGRRARRRADQAADATPTAPPPSGLAPTRAQPRTRCALNRRTLPPTANPHLFRLRQGPGASLLPSMVVAPGSPRSWYPNGGGGVGCTRSPGSTSDFHPTRSTNWACATGSAEDLAARIRSRCSA